MNSPDVNVAASTHHGRDEHGSILILGILMLLIATVLALTLIGTTETEVKVSSRFDDHNKALAAAEAGISEALWRLRMRDDPSQPPPAGSQVSGYGIPDVLAASSPDRYHVRADSAYINPDPFRISHTLVSIPSITKQKGDGLNQDVDAFTDEVDELDAWRDWDARIVYGNYDASKQVFDSDPLDLSSVGSHLVLPSVLDPDVLTTAAARSQTGTRLRYTTSDETSPDVLRVRYLREDPDFRDYCVRRGCINPSTLLADMDMDGLNELVYYDELLPTNGEEDKQAIAGGDDATIDNESPYNLDHRRRDGVLGSHTASGYPVLVIEATGRVEKAGKTIARRRLQARFTYYERKLISTAICTCDDMEVSGSLKIFSYDSRAGRCAWNQALSGYPWIGADCPLNTIKEANIGSNGDIIYSGSVDIYGSVLAGGTITINGSPDIRGGKARARGAIASCSDIDWLDPVATGDGGARCRPNDTELEPPCACLDVQDEVQKRETSNNNAAIRYWPAGPCTDATAQTPADPENLSYDSGFLMLPSGGEYYFETLDLTDNVRVLSGVVNALCRVVANPAEPISLYVKDTFNKPADDYLVFERLRPSEFSVWYWGNGTPQDFDFGSNTNTILNLIAPYSVVDFAGGARIAGSIQAKESAGGKLNGSAEFYYDRNVGKAQSGTRPPGVIDWRELP